MPAFSASEEGFQRVGLFSSKDATRPTLDILDRRSSSAMRVAETFTLLRTLPTCGAPRRDLCHTGLLEAWRIAVFAPTHPRALGVGNRPRRCLGGI